MPLQLIDKISERESDGILLPLFNDYLDKWALNTKPRDRSGYISPSSMLGCQQAAINQVRGIMGVNTKTGRDQLFLEKHLKGIHTFLQEMWVDAGLITQDSVEQWVEYPPFRLGGEIDGEMPIELIEQRKKDGALPSGVKRCLIDYKSGNFRMFARAAAGGEHLYNWRHQATCYMLCKFLC